MTGSAGVEVTVRMYNPGFGDCFLVTATGGDQVWRMLIDCGVHPHGRARPIADTVRGVISDLTELAPPGGRPRLDVVAATHRHADHISGFAVADWDSVEVGQVWLPFVEDPDDPDVLAFTQEQHRVVSTLSALAAAPAQRSPALNLAAAMAANSAPNAAAMGRLVQGRFATTAAVHFLPAPEEVGPQALATTVPGAEVLVLGPPRDLAHLRRMDPPAAVAWLTAQAAALGTGTDVPLFDPVFLVPADEVPTALAELARVARLSTVASPDDDVLAAAAAVEHAINNTSLFLVLRVGDLRLVFPGDAQQGAWEHVLEDPARATLVTGPTFYKVGHHGSHNATPRAFVTDRLGHGAWAMLPYGRVAAWAATIPKAELLAALAEHDTRLVRADQASQLPGVSADPEGRWVQITLTAAEQEASDHG